MRRAERLAAAQSAQIGIAQADLYPAFSIDGTLGYAAQRFPDLFRPSSLNGNIGPSFQWNILNYGRIATTSAPGGPIRRTGGGLPADGLQRRPGGREWTGHIPPRPRADQVSGRQCGRRRKSGQIALAQYKAGSIDFTRVTQLEEALVQQQDVLAQAQGEIATGLIQVYRALGGGWQIRLNGCQPSPLPDAERLPPVQPEPVSPTSPKNRKD